MNRRRKIAIVLWIIQVLGLLGSFVSGSYLGFDLFNWIGFFLPGIIGACLWFSKKNKKD